MNNNKRMVCPVCISGLLDSKFRRSLHNPQKILRPYIQKNMTVLDIGCGPGVFTLTIAELLEGTGKVIAVDMQEEMLAIIQNKINGKPIANNIVLHKCSQDSINVREKVDFVLMFYMVHEVPSKENLFNEVLPLINKGGLLMIAEPGVLPAAEFNGMVQNLKDRGFEEYQKIRIMFSKSIVLKKL